MSDKTDPNVIAFVTACKNQFYANYTIFITETLRLFNENYIFPDFRDAALRPSTYNKLSNILRRITKIPNTYSVPQLEQLQDTVLILINEFGATVTDTRLSFIVHDVVLTDYYDDISHDFGSFEVSLIPYGLTLKNPSRFKDYYRVTALDSAKAYAHDSNFPHPHINRTELCEGDAFVGIQNALQSYDLVSFYLLVTGLITNYNSEGAYQPLNKWVNSSQCFCGNNSYMYEDAEIYCELCDNVLCDDCSQCCAECDTCACGNCLNYCSSCEQDLCNGCYEDHHFKCDCCDTSICKNTNNYECENCDAVVCEECHFICGRCIKNFCKNCGTAIEHNPEQTTHCEVDTLDRWYCDDCFKEMENLS